MRGRKWSTTIADASAPRPADLVARNFRAGAQTPLGRRPDLRAHLGGFRYVAFVFDVYSRFIFGWRRQPPAHRPALDALEMALWQRRATVAGLVHHSDRGVQYLSIRYTERLAEAGAVTSVGSRGDAYDNALAETVIGLYKTELIRKRGPWRNLTQSSSPRWNGSTGSTTRGCSSRSATSRRQSSRKRTMLTQLPCRQRKDSNKRASTEAGAVQVAQFGVARRAVLEALEERFVLV